MGRTYYSARYMDTTDERRRKRRIRSLLRPLPPGQYRVAILLISDAKMTYPGVAAALGIHVGTVSQHLRRIRQRHPCVYTVLMTERKRQLNERSRQALANAKEHSRIWLQMQGLWTYRAQ